MKRLSMVVAACTLLLLGGFGHAQDLFGTRNVFATVTFTRGDPGASFYRLTTVGMNNSPVAHTLAGIDGATHVTIDFQDARYTFALAGSGWHKQNIVLTVPEGSGVQIGHGGRASLAELFDRLVTDPTLLARLSGPALAGR
jgi:hypothetical protein